MIVKIDLAGFGETNWHEYAARFVAGGVITVVAGLIATKWGPGVGGLFLAFPAIFPASATLVAKHERERKQKYGMNGKKRAADVAAADATGAAIGSLGLTVFAASCWWCLPRYPAGWVLAGATSAWGLVSVLGWFVRKRGWGRFRGQPGLK